MKKNVFVFFWLPYAAKYTYQTFLTAFYIAINRIPAEQCIHIGPPTLFQPPPPELPGDWLNSYGCHLPSSQELSSLPKRTIDPAVFNDVQQQLLSNNLVWKYLLTQRHAGLENELSRILVEISSTYNIEAILAWGNTPSLSRVAQHYGLKVIHHEMGPLRSPFYTHTAYLDFNGVNGNTEAASRFTDFKNNTDARQLKTLSLKALLSIFGEEQYFSEIFKTISPEFDIGVPLQVEDDSNILAFSNGFNNYEVIAFARSQSERVLIRKHPSGHANYLAIQDNSGSVIEFTKRVNRIITINSSVGFEAMLYGKSCQVLGDSPFAFIANSPDGEREHNLLVAINFFLFGYLIPFKLLFNLEYYRWRLREPSEIEIYNFHLDYYFKRRGLPAAALLSSDRLEVEALARSEKTLANLTDINRNSCNAVDIPTSEQLESELNIRSEKIAAPSPFVSYAQNFEDVMLWRALKYIEHGCYVDVGAQHPVIDSVSKAFYERGWRGIHIEPVSEYADLLRKDRPDEIVLQVALADTEGTLKLNVIADTGLSTAVEAYAQAHQVERGLAHQRIQVPVLTLKSALTSLVGKEVHWLKIDVEGLEEKVLRGWDSEILRPWIIVVEATIPYSPETDYASWEPILTAADYQFVYFDGLNRFYVAKEHGELAKAFSCPPNVFDGVQLSGLASSELCRGLIASHQASEKELAAQAQKLAIELNAANEHNTKLQAHAEWLQNEWDAAKQRVEEFSQRTVQLGAELQAALAHESRLQAHAEWLQNEWDAAKQRVEEFSQRTGKLEGEVDSERQRTMQLEAELQVAREHESRLQAHTQWLQNEWDRAKTKIGELNRFSHHWWSVTDGLNRELQRVCAGKSWHVTRRLRLVLSLPKRIAKPLVVWVMRRSLASPRLKAGALDVLSKHPELYQRLRQFAMRSGLITGGNMTAPISHPLNPDSGSENTVATTCPPNMPEESIKNLSSRAARIYTDLKKAIGTRKS